MAAAAWGYPEAGEESLGHSSFLKDRGEIAPPRIGTPAADFSV
jgi:hypothetical protein